MGLDVGSLASSERSDEASAAGSSVEADTPLHQPTQLRNLHSNLALLAFSETGVQEPFGGGGRSAGGGDTGAARGGGRQPGGGGEG